MVPISKPKQELPFNVRKTCLNCILASLFYFCERTEVRDGKIIKAILVFEKYIPTQFGILKTTLISEKEMLLAFLIRTYQLQYKVNVINMMCHFLLKRSLFLQTFFLNG